MNRFLMILVALFLTCAVAACGSSSSGNSNEDDVSTPEHDDGANHSDDGDSDNDDDEDNNGDNSDDADDTPTVNPLLGTWTSECHLTPQGNDNIITRAFGPEGAANVTIQAFQSDSGTCSGTPTEINAVFNYEIGNALTTDSGVTAQELDAELVSDPQGVFTGSSSTFDIFHIDANNVLYFSVGGADSEAQRPTSINFNVPYARQ